MLCQQETRRAIKCQSCNTIAYSRGVRLNLLNLVPQKQAGAGQLMTTGVEEEVGVMGMLPRFKL